MAAANKGRSPNGETPYTRSYFYIGGEYVDDGSGDHIFRDQMYVEKLTPISGGTQRVPVVIIHGLGQTGTVSSTELSLACVNTYPTFVHTELSQ